MMGSFALAQVPTSLNGELQRLGVLIFQPFYFPHDRPKSSKRSYPVALLYPRPLLKFLRYLPTEVSRSTMLTLRIPLAPMFRFSPISRCLYQLARLSVSSDLPELAKAPSLR